MKLIDEATGEPPVLHKNDRVEWTHTAWLTDGGLVEQPDAVDGDGVPVQLVRVIRAFDSVGEHKLVGHGTVVTVKNPGGVPDPGALRGRIVLVDGKRIFVRGVESFAIGLPYPDHLDFAFLVGEVCPCGQHAADLVGSYRGAPVYSCENVSIDAPILVRPVS